jgi:hypothetical protein
MKKYRILGLFDNFDEAFSAVSEIRHARVPGVSVDDVTLNSPIEHPEIEEVLGERPIHVPKFTLAGASFGLIFGFLFIAGAQASFLVQPQGGKPVVPLPSNFVLVYEMLIFFGVWTTFFAFLFLAGLFRKRHNLYSEKVSLDQVGVIVELSEANLEPMKALFKEHKVVEVREEEIQ